MSDIRTKILMGTSIGAVSIMLVMAVGVVGLENNASTSFAGLGITGHVTLVAVNPDGTTSYVQGDNELIGTGKDAIGNHLFDEQNQLAHVINCVQLGEGVFAAGSAGVNGPLATTELECDATGDLTTAGVTGGGGGAVNTIKVQFTIHEDDGPTTLTNVGLGTGTENSTTLVGIVSHAQLDADVQVNDNAVVTLTYLLTTG